MEQSCVFWSAFRYGGHGQRPHKVGLFSFQHEHRVERLVVHVNIEGAEPLGDRRREGRSRDGEALVAHGRQQQSKP